MDRKMSFSRLVLSATAVSIFVLTCFSGSHAAEPAPIGVKEGEMYPDFLLPTIDGTLAKLSDYRGKKILLFHFASW